MEVIITGKLIAFTKDEFTNNNGEVIKYAYCLLRDDEGNLYRFSTRAEMDLKSDLDKDVRLVGKFQPTTSKACSLRIVDIEDEE